MREFLAKWIHGPTLAVAATSLGGEVLNGVFYFYYIKVFLNIYHMNDAWLNIAQILFMIWNAVNDPLFGFMQDIGCGSRMKWITKRRKVILYMGPIYSISFMVAWIPWNYGSVEWLVGLHLIVSLFVFDAMLSLVLSAQCGLFTELTTEHAGRIRVVVYMEIAALLGSFAILPVDKISRSLDNFLFYQITCVVVAIFSALCFIYSGIMSSKEVAQVEEKKEKDVEGREEGEDTLMSRVKEGMKSSKEILTNRDFWSVVLGNFFHIMRNLGNANFLAIFTEALISPSGILAKGTIEISLFYTACQVVPKMFLALCWPLLKRYGAWSLTMGTIVLTVVNSFTAFFVGRYFFSGLAFFFLVENILCRALWPAVYNVFFPDIIDEDMKENKRKSPLSTLIFTMNALFTKPAISLAPIIIVRFLYSANYHTYESWRQDIDKHDKAGNSTWYNGTATMMTPTAMPETDLTYLFDCMFRVALFFPLVCGILEAICLAPYRLKFRHKRDEEQMANHNVPEQVNQSQLPQQADQSQLPEQVDQSQLPETQQPNSSETATEQTSPTQKRHHHRKKHSKSKKTRMDETNKDTTV